MTTRGLCWELLDKVILEQEFLTAQLVMDEFARILVTKFKVSPEKTAATTTYLLEAAERVSSTSITLPESPDPNDAPILACALAGKADLFVTGDKALLEMTAVENMPIVSPREYWERMARMG